MLQLVNYSDDSISSGDENKQSYSTPNDTQKDDATKGHLQQMRDFTAVGKKDLPKNVDDKKANVSVVSAKKKKRLKNLFKWDKFFFYIVLHCKISTYLKKKK